MTIATGIGSMPGDDLASALQVVLDELAGDRGEHGLPFLPELPARGVTSGMIGRTLSLVDGIGVDLQPAGWRLTDSNGVDHRRALRIHYRAPDYRGAGGADLQHGGSDFQKQEGEDR